MIENLTVTVPFNGDELYEILEDYVTDTVGSYTALQEFIHDRREDFLDSLSEGKDLDDYGSKVDALVDSMGVTDEKESTTHRRKDLDLL